MPAMGAGSAVRDNRFLWSLIAALVVHTAGLIGMVWGDPAWFSAKTPLNLSLMFGLLILNQHTRNKSFYLFAILSFLTGMVTEMIGVHTGILFGDYAYGTILGPSVNEVPLLIGVNWFVTMFISTSTAAAILRFPSFAHDDHKYSSSVRFGWLPLLGAGIATAFDWIMEPVAVKLGFWSWSGDGNIPLLNYVCWFIISYSLILAAGLFRVDLRNRFSIPLLIIQAVFFLLLRLLS
jgi:bisanhydrobacterioruberin hydratase